MNLALVDTAPRVGPPPASETFALVALLEQIRDVLTLLPPSVYVGRPAARVSGSVGEHVRHCVDHVHALTTALEGEALSYDSRLRGTRTEIDPSVAINEIERLFYRLDRLTTIPAERAIFLSTLVDQALPPRLVRTTIGREIAFVVQHTIHHCALVAVLLEWQGCRVPKDFGVAPSTVRARTGAR